MFAAFNNTFKGHFLRWHIFLQSAGVDFPLAGTFSKLHFESQWGGAQERSDIHDNTGSWKQQWAEYRDPDYSSVTHRHTEEGGTRQNNLGMSSVPQRHDYQPMERAKHAPASPCLNPRTDSGDGVLSSLFFCSLFQPCLWWRGWGLHWPSLIMVEVTITLITFRSYTVWATKMQTFPQSCRLVHFNVTFMQHENKGKQAALQCIMGIMFKLLVSAEDVSHFRTKSGANVFLW